MIRMGFKSDDSNFHTDKKIGVTFDDENEAYRLRI